VGHFPLGAGRGKPAVMVPILQTGVWLGSCCIRLPGYVCRGSGGCLCFVFLLFNALLLITKLGGFWRRECAIRHIAKFIIQGRSAPANA